MFNRKPTKDLENENTKLKSQISDLKDEIRELKNMREDDIRNFESENKIRNSEIKTRINEELAEKTKENNNLLVQVGVLKKEVEILEKAFENMGFDVKDMKQILDKLVDGLIEKNKINVIK